MNRSFCVPAWKCLGRLNQSVDEVPELPRCAIVRHGGDAPTSAIAHFAKVTRSCRPGLFHCHATPGLPRTNNDLDQLLASQRQYEQRANGRRTASPAVLRGEVRLVAATTTRRHPPTERQLGAPV